MPVNELLGQAGRVVLGQKRRRPSEQRRGTGHVATREGAAQRERAVQAGVTLQ